MNRITVSPSLFFPPVLLMVLFLWISFYGLNFGVHWDEVAAKFDSVRDTVKTGLFIQGSGGAPDGYHYNYGGVNYLLTWTGFAPELWTYFKSGNMTRAGLSDLLAPLIYTMPIRLRVRAIYLVLCSLSILWLYLLNIVLGRSRLEAFLASAFLAASWEVQYHSRWIAPDEVMMQFVLLSFLLLAVGWYSKKVSWFYLGSIAIGLAIGTKYTAGLVLPFFLLGAVWVLWQHHRSITVAIKHGIAFCGAAFLTFVITSPGIVIDPFHFFYQLRLQRTVYATGWYGYTVRPGLSHFVAIVRYFSLQVFSHYMPLSVVVALFCLLGFTFIVRGTPRLVGLVMTGFVVAYVAYFSQQAAMIVRNLLVVAPVFCLAAARGVTVAAEKLNPKFPKLKAGLYAYIAIVLIINVGWEMYTADQIKRREHFDYFLMKFEGYARSSPNDTFLISAKLASALHGIQPVSIPANIVTNPDTPYTKVAFLQSDGPDLERNWPTWPSNWWGMYERTFGAMEVNLDAYPTFVGNQRILLVTAAHFKRLPIKTADLLGNIPGQ